MAKDRYELNMIFTGDIVNMDLALKENTDITTSSSPDYEKLHTSPANRAVEIRRLECGLYGQSRLRTISLTLGVRSSPTQRNSGENACYISWEFERGRRFCCRDRRLGWRMCRERGLRNMLMLRGRNAYFEIGRQGVRALRWGM